MWSQTLPKPRLKCLPGENSDVHVHVLYHTITAGNDISSISCLWSQLRRQRCGQKLPGNEDNSHLCLCDPNYVCMDKALFPNNCEDTLLIRTLLIVFCCKSIRNIRRIPLQVQQLQMSPRQPVHVHVYMFTRVISDVTRLLAINYLSEQEEWGEELDTNMLMMVEHKSFNSWLLVTQSVITWSFGLLQ